MYFVHLIQIIKTCTVYRSKDRVINNFYKDTVVYESKISYVSRTYCTSGNFIAQELNIYSKLSIDIDYIATFIIHIPKLPDMSHSYSTSDVITIKKPKIIERYQ